MNLIWQLPALLGILTTGVVYGTDAFCALVQRPALARVDDATLTATMGNIHRYGDKRMPPFGIASILASILTAVLAAVTGHVLASISAGLAVLIWLAWLIVYLRVSAPINRVLTAAADRRETPPNTRSLQQTWDRVIVLRASLLGAAIVALGAAILS